MHKLFPKIAAITVALLLTAVPALAHEGHDEASHDGTLIKGSGRAVYYFGGNGKRYVFTNDKNYFSWYESYGNVATITDAELAKIPIGGNVTYRPGKKMLKIQSDSRTYAVDAGGELRPIKDEATAKAIYGNNWNKMIDDVDVSFFVNYRLGEEIDSANDYSAAAALNDTTDIADDKGIPKYTGGYPIKFTVAECTVPEGSTKIAETTTFEVPASGADLNKLPLGDGKFTSKGTYKGYIYSCADNMIGVTPSGAAWVNGEDGTWNANQKTGVSGSKTWPAEYAMIIGTFERTKRFITSNGLPKNGTTGEFPVAITAQSYSLTIPTTPVVGTAPKCVSNQVGITVTGVPIYSALEGGYDAPAHAALDACGGHPAADTGAYHYHSASHCIAAGGIGTKNLLGYAMDGFGIYGNVDASGATLTTSDLDECHGTTSQVMWDGKLVNMYHYVATSDYPYTVGCFRGTVVVDDFIKQQCSAR